MAKKGDNSAALIIMLAVVLPMALVALVGIAAAIAIPSFMSYLQRAKTQEARVNVAAIHQGLASAVASGTLSEAPRIARTPLEPACRSKQLVDWGAADPGWAAIGFGPPDPLYYAYEVEPRPGGAYVIRASGDLDCDGVYSTFELHGRVDPSTRQAIREPGLVVADENE